MPSIDIDACPIEYIEKTYAMTSLTMRELLNIKHSFSHFHLEIKALALQTVSPSNTVAEHPGKWFHPAEISQLGLAKPVSSILKHFLSVISSNLIPFGAKHQERTWV